MTSNSRATIALVILAVVPWMTLAATADEALVLRSKVAEALSTRPAKGVTFPGLALAVRNGDVAAARSLLANRANANHPLPDGATPLAWAVERQDREMVRLLLDRGAKPSSAGTSSLTPLLIACQLGDHAILDMLLTAGANTKAARADGITALSMCAANAPTAIVERLISAGAEVNEANDRGQTPLMWAAAKGRVDNLQLLLKHGADINQTSTGGFTPLFFALKSGDPRAPIAVIEAGGNADYIAPDGTSVVQLAMYQSAYDFAARMIERGVTLTAFDRNGNQLLHAAVLANQPSLVTLLLAKGADVNALTGPSQVKWRFEVNFKTGDYNVPPKSALLLAAESGRAGIMRMLVDAGADTRFCTSEGTNIVLAAATSGHIAALELALQQQPDPNVTTTNGQTPLHLLLGSNATPETAAMMKLLADKGARIDLKNRAGQTPADFAKEAQTEMKTAFEATFANRTVGT